MEVGERGLQQPDVDAVLRSVNQSQIKCSASDSAHRDLPADLHGEKSIPIERSPVSGKLSCESFARDEEGASEAMSLAFGNAVARHNPLVDD